MKPSLLVLLLFIPFLLIADESVSDALRLIEGKNYDAARKILEAIIVRDGSDAGAHYHLGRILANPYNEYDEAEKHLEKAVELVDGNAEYHFTLGNFYGGQAQRAGIFSKLSYAGNVRTEFLRAVELDQHTVRYRIALMSYYLMAPGIAGGSVAKAKEQAEEISKRDPYEGHLALAQIAAYEKEPETAEQAYRSAIKADPSKWRAHHMLGYLLLEQKRIDEAVAEFREYVRLAPADANSHDSLGDGLLAKGDVNQALQSYLRAATVNPQWPSPLFNVARCYERIGQKGEALQYYRKFLAMNPQGQNAKEAEQKVQELTGR